MTDLKMPKSHLKDPDTQAWAAAIPGKVFEFLDLNSKQKLILSLLFWNNAHFNSRIVNCYQITECQQKMPELLTWKFNFWKHPTILESLPPRSGWNATNCAKILPHSSISFTNTYLEIKAYLLEPWNEIWFMMISLNNFVKMIYLSFYSFYFI